MNESETENEEKGEKKRLAMKWIGEEKKKNFFCHFLPDQKKNLIILSSDFF